METLAEDLLLLAVRPNGKLGAAPKKAATRERSESPAADASADAAAHHGGAAGGHH
jgi:hypothetical protein